MPKIPGSELRDNKWKYENMLARKLTPLEAERMQGIPDDYTKSASKTNREKMIGNGFTIQVIEFLLRGMVPGKIETNTKTSVELYDRHVPTIF